LGDGDRKLKAEERQIDLIHVWREVNYKLWEHKVDLETRKRYVNEVKGILLRLKNSLDKPDLERIKRAERMKNKWMKWSERGAENLGNLLMKMRFERASYESFIDEVMKLDRDIR